MKFSAALLGLASVVTAAKSFHRPDSHWDFIVKGEETKRAVSNHPAYLADYQLRGKAVDPSSLGVDNVTQFSGYLDDNTNNKHLFYWFFESRNDPKNDPVVLWLSGGPGCSSMGGLMFELGPATVDSQLQVHNNPNSWNTKANVLFLDQPVNTGYSYGDGVDTTLAASKDVYSLLALFFKQFPQYAKQDFHIAGESYAGHYIPEDASEILSHANSGINLKSIMIGNGLTDPKTQYAYYPPMACGKGGHPAVLSSSTCSSMQNAVASCQAAIQKCYDSGSTNDCNAPARACNNVDGPYYNRQNANPYDVTKACEPNSGGLCYTGMNYVQQYFNQQNVMNALGAEVQEFDNCNNQVNSDFHSTGDSFKPLHRPVPGILAAGVPVLIYAGDSDYICNWLGNQAWTNALDWPGKSAFNSASTVNLTSGGSAYGTIKSAQKLAFARIFNAGHLVPHDKGAASLDLIDRWIAGEWNK